MMNESTSPDSVPTGIAGLDDILRGGLPAGKMYLLAGGPGTGKTTFSLQFIAEGIRRRERCLYIAVGAGGEDFAALAEAWGIFLDPSFFSIHAIEISGEILEGPEQRIFHPAETEPTEAMKNLFAEIQRAQPQRLVLDSLSDLRLLTEDLVSFRRLVLALRHEIGSGESTVIITNTYGSAEIDIHLKTICHGVLLLEQVVLGYGPIRRRLLILKLRGLPYRTGWHDFRIVTGGVRVFPTLVAGEHRVGIPRKVVASGNPQLDALFGGGLDRGSTTAIIGASGTGKTTVATQFAVAAAQRGEPVAIYIFEETAVSFRERAEGLGMKVGEFIDRGLITLRQVDVAEFSTGEFTFMLCREMEETGTRMVVIDSLGGYASTMREDRFLTVQLHELLTYLSHHGVTTLLAVEQHGLFGNQAKEMKDVSYLADSMLLLRFFEHRGEIRRAISAVKRRRGPHENTIRELTIAAGGIVVGEPLVEMQGVLAGVPILNG
jgi:circadian clock protein KaiC